MTESYPAPVSRPRAHTFASVELLLLVTVLMWGINFVVLKISLRSFSPMAFNALRFSIASIIITGFMFWRGEPWHLSRRELGGTVLLGLSGHTLYQTIFINGLARTAAASASLLLATAPIFVAIYGYLMHTERMQARFWAGALLSFAGMSLLILGGSGAGLAAGNVLGDLLILASALLWAAYLVGSRPLLARLSALKVTALSMLAGTPPLVLLSLPELARQDWAAVAPEAWAGLLYSAVLSIAVGYVLWSIGLQRVGSARTAVYQNAVPVVAVAVSWLVLGDRLALLQSIGAAAVLAGILLARRRAGG